MSPLFVQQNQLFFRKIFVSARDDEQHVGGENYMSSGVVLH